jgi:hypothetical protein
VSDELDGCLLDRRKSKNNVRTNLQNHRQTPTDFTFAPN